MYPATRPDPPPPGRAVWCPRRGVVSPGHQREPDDHGPGRLATDPPRLVLQPPGRPQTDQSQGPEHDRVPHQKRVCDSEGIKLFINYTKHTKVP